jgi:hypothetical protein
VFRRDFYFWYRLVLLGVGAAWNAAICWRPGGSFAVGLRDFLLEMLPIVALMLLARRIGERVILIGAALIHAVLVFVATRAVFFGGDPIPLVVAPLLTLFAVVPGALVAAWIIRRQAQR